MVLLTSFSRVTVTSAIVPHGLIVDTSKYGHGSIRGVLPALCTFMRGGATLREKTIGPTTLVIDSFE